MMTLHPQYITDTAGEKLVVLSISEFNSIMDELDAVEDVRLYHEAKKQDDGERIPMAEVLKKLDTNRKIMDK
ncbi:MAG: hypothetical protein H7257_02640 [Taibaiella sp.]|nr:hypothetical protein [Taibaiella sp.]